MKTTFNDFINEYKGPGSKIGFRQNDGDGGDLYKVNFVVNNITTSQEENTKNLKKLLNYYDIKNDNFDWQDLSEVNDTVKEGQATFYAFNFRAYDDKESTSVMKNIVKAFDIIPDSIKVDPVLPWEKDTL